MNKRSFASLAGPAVGLVGFWKTFKSLSSGEITRHADRPFHIALIGPDDDTAEMAERLSRNPAVTRIAPDTPAVNINSHISRHEVLDDAPLNSIVLNASLLLGSDTAWDSALASIVANRPDLQLALPRHIPAFRPAATARIIHEDSWKNAKIAIISALPGVVPMADILLPATSMGDMLLLTRNQAMLLLKIAAAYGLPIDFRARSRELIPVIGSGFGWRAAARELIGILPGGIGVAVKGAIGYAGTYAVGRAAVLYYSSGQQVTGSVLKKLYKEGYREVSGRLRQLVRPGARAAAVRITADQQIDDAAT